MPLRPQRSSRRRTPQSEQPTLIPQRSPRRTPSFSQPLVPRSSTRRTPTSARNHLPERPSPYDIPGTGDEERGSSSQTTRSDSQGSVSKKRKITGMEMRQLFQQNELTDCLQGQRQLADCLRLLKPLCWRHLLLGVVNRNLPPSLMKERKLPSEIGLRLSVIQEWLYQIPGTMEIKIVRSR